MYLKIRWQWRVVLAVLQLLCFGILTTQQEPLCEIPFFEFEGQCTTTCPRTHFGNSSSMHCERYPTDYSIRLNATLFCADFTVDTPPLTNVLDFSVNINNPNQSFYAVIINIKGDTLFESGVFGLESNPGSLADAVVISTDESSIIIDHSLVYHGSDMLQSDLQLPITLSFSISVTGTGEFDADSTSAPAKLTVRPSIDHCPCQPSRCENGGTCVVLVRDYECVCPLGFTGNNCQFACCLSEVSVPLFPETVTAYDWMTVKNGTTQRQPCPLCCQDLLRYPEGAVVRRECVSAEGGGAQWLSVDFRECLLDVTTLMLCETNKIDSPAVVAEDTANITNNASSLDSFAVTVVSRIIEDLTKSAIEIEEVREPYLQIIDNVMDVTADVILESRAESNASVSILQSLELFSDSVLLQENGRAFTMNNFAVLVEDFDQSSSTRTNMVFSANLGPVDHAVDGTRGIEEGQLVRTSEVTPDATASIELPMSSFEMISRFDNGSQRLSFGVFLSSTLFLTPENNDSICSIILSLRAPEFGETLQENVILNFQKLSSVCGSTCSCANYDTTSAGQWTRENCRVVSESDDNCRCECSQLGHFGLLFDLSPGTPLSPPALAIITYIGAGVSITCLIITVGTYCASKKLRSSEHGQLLVNLCVALLGLYITFLIGGHVTSVPPLCGVVSALLHYFILVFFASSAAEAVLLYSKLVTIHVTGLHMPYFVAKAALVVWVTPVIIVAVSAGAGYEYYTNPFYCRPTEFPFWFGLVLPFVIIYLFNWLIFALIMWSLARKRLQSKDNVKELTRTAVGLSPLFGLGWGLGLAATTSDVDEVTFSIQVLFSVFVGFQGFSIFIFHGACSKEARKQWRSWFHWLPCLQRMGRRQYRPSQSRQSPQNPLPSSESFVYQTSTLSRSRNRSSAVPPLASPEEAAPHDHFNESNEVQSGELAKNNGVTGD